MDDCPVNRAALSCLRPETCEKNLGPDKEDAPPLIELDCDDAPRETCEKDNCEVCKKKPSPEKEDEPQLEDEAKEAEDPVVVCPGSTNPNLDCNCPPKKQC